MSCADPQERPTGPETRSAKAMEGVQPEHMPRVASTKLGEVAHELRKEID